MGISTDFFFSRVSTKIKKGQTFVVIMTFHISVNNKIGGTTIDRCALIAFVAIFCSVFVANVQLAYANFVSFSRQLISDIYALWVFLMECKYLSQINFVCRQENVALI